MARRVTLDPEALPVALKQSPRAKLKALVVGSWYAFMAVVGAVLVAGAGAEAVPRRRRFTISAKQR